MPMRKISSPDAMPSKSAIIGDEPENPYASLSAQINAGMFPHEEALEPGEALNVSGSPGRHVISCAEMPCPSACVASSSTRTLSSASERLLLRGSWRSAARMAPRISSCDDCAYESIGVMNKSAMIAAIAIRERVTCIRISYQSKSPAVCGAF